MPDLTLSSPIDTFLQASSALAGRNVLLPTAAMGALVIDTSKAVNTKSISGDTAFTFSGAPLANTFFSLLIRNTDTDFAKTITFPSSHSLYQNGVITTASVPPNVISVSGYMLITWFYDGSEYYIMNEVTQGLIPAAGGYSVVYGYQAGLGASADYNAFFGYRAGLLSPSAGQSCGFGYQAGYNPGGYAGSFFGYESGKSGGGTSACGFGYRTLFAADSTGTGNVAIGVHAGEVVTTMSGTICIGYHALNGVTNGTGSVVIGDHSADQLANVNNCIFLGPYSGVSRNHTLWIEGQGTAIGSHTPLLYGEFDNDYLKVNGLLETTDGIKFPTSDPLIAGAWWDNAGTLTKSAG